MTVENPKDISPRLAYTPILETERLILRPLTLNDAPAVFGRWASDIETTRYMAWPHHESIEDTQEWLVGERQTIDSRANYNFGFVLKENTQLIGSGGLHYGIEGDHFAIGYIISKEYWNEGIVTEAMRRILSYAIDTLGINEFHVYHAVANPASGAVAKKLGFRFTRESTYKSNDGLRDLPRCEYILTAENFVRA